MQPRMARAVYAPPSGTIASMRILVMMHTASGGLRLFNEGMNKSCIAACISSDIWMGVDWEG